MYPPVLKWHTPWNHTRHLYYDMAYNLHSLYYTYSVRVIVIIDSLEESNGSRNGLIFVKATKAATRMEVAHVK